MFSIWTLVAITLGYMFFLFAIATLGNRAKRLPKSVYSLALGIHCTSWAFFGTTTQAANFGWPLIPTYLGVIVVMLVGFRLLLRVNTICKQYNISSIAEFVSIRFEHSNAIAVIVTLICFIGVIPYIALQLDAITLALNLLLIDADTWSGSISFYVTVGMAIFAIWFGARNMSLTERNSGLMLTIAFQSLVKLLALCVVGFFVVYWVFDGAIDLFEQSLNFSHTRQVIDKPFAIWVYFSHVLLGICSMFCLPRQFHINFVENRGEEELRQARWLFVSYLLGMSVFILPIAMAGMLLFGLPSVISTPIGLDPSTINPEQVSYSTDSYVLAIPIAFNNAAIAVVAFIGGLAASSSMVIVATLALGNMVANSVITPLFFKVKSSKTIAGGISGNALLRIRQATILIMLCIAYAYHINVSQLTPLAETGTIALSLLSQTFPAILLGIYWRKASRAGAISGIVLGMLTVAFGMLYPALQTQSSIVENSNYSSAEQIAFVLFISLLVNALAIILISLVLHIRNTSLGVVALNPYASSALQVFQSNIRLQDLLKLSEQILPPAKAKEFRSSAKFVDEPDAIAPIQLLKQGEKLLSSHMGSASTRILLSAIATREDNQRTRHQDLNELVEQAGKSFQFNNEVLQASITNLPLGVSVVDANLRLVAWNKLYELMFDYPTNFLHVGKPIIEILEFNAKRGLIGHSEMTQSPPTAMPTTSTTSDSQQQEIQKRMQNMLNGKSYKAVRPQIQNKVIEISGNPLPAGGYITCYSDITEYIHIQNELESAKIDLEKRVKRRTHQLQLAKTEAEEANLGKTKFLAATSHDLMQPLSAASLFASMLDEKLRHSNASELTANLVNSLDNAEALLGMLVEITKLENKLIKPNMQSFALDDVLSQQVSEFAILAKQKNIKLHFVRSSIWIYSDRRLLSRIVQNLLSNAIRYTESGKILVGVRRHSQKHCNLIIADTGSGIALEDQAKVFTEFKRVDPNDKHQGLGLGLTIVDKISQLLDYKIQLRSHLGEGSLFSLQLKRTDPIKKSSNTNLANKSEVAALFLSRYCILLLENDDAVSTALKTLLSNWGATVIHAKTEKEALNIIQKHAQAPDLIIADFHLDDGDTGVDVVNALQHTTKQTFKTILSSADRSEEIQAMAYEHNMQYLPKPIKQAALKRMIQKMLTQG